jgi:hypothetical protein
MKTINCNSWAPRNVKWASYHEWSRPRPVPITNPSILNDGNLYYSFYVFGGLAIFYYRLKAMIYHSLNKDGYFNEDG